MAESSCHKCHKCAALCCCVQEEEETLRSRRVPNAVTSLEADYLQNADGMLAAASGNGLSSTINTAPLPLSALSHSAAALDRMSAHAGGAAGTAGGSDSWQLAVQRAAGAGSAGVAAAGGQPSQEAILRRRVDMLAKLFPAADRVRQCVRCMLTYLLCSRLL